MPFWQRILRVALPAVLIVVFALWMFLTPEPVKNTVPQTGNNSASRFDVATVDTRTQTALEQVVHAQIDALRRRDYARALRLAAPSFSEEYTPATFAHMLQTGYAELASPLKAICHNASLSGITAMMPVTVQAQNGIRNNFLYVFLHQGRLWRITGVSHATQGQDMNFELRMRATSGR